MSESGRWSGELWGREVESWVARPGGFMLDSLRLVADALRLAKHGLVIGFVVTSFEIRAIYTLDGDLKDTW